MDEVTKIFLELRGIEPRASHMQSERSTTELQPKMYRLLLLLFLLVVLLIINFYYYYYYYFQTKILKKFLV